MVPGLPYALPPAAAAAIERAASAPVIRQQRPTFTLGEVTIEADVGSFDAESKVNDFTGNVVVQYKGLKLEADKVKVDLGRQRVEFSKVVRITDEIGSLVAEDVWAELEEIVNASADLEPEARFRLKRAVATNIVLDAWEAHFTGERLEIVSGVWKLYNASATTCDRKRPDYIVYCKELTLRPGRTLVGKNARVRFGKGLSISVPFFTINLDPRQTGLLLPAPIFGDGFKFGYRWRNLFLLGYNAQFYYEQSALHDAVPYVNSHVAFTLQHRSKNVRQTPISIRNEDQERFQNGFLDNVVVKSPQEEENNIAQGASAFFVGRSTNLAPSARLGPPIRLDRNWFIGVQTGDKIGDIPVQLQVIYGEINERLTAQRITRIETYAAALLPKVAITESLSFRLRADVGSFFGAGESFGWIRPQAALVFKPSDMFQMSAAYVSATSWGTPTFQADRLFSSRAIHFRVDLTLPSTDLSLLLKYDFDRNQIYDYEIYFGQLAHCVRPYFAWRKFPNSFTFGMTLDAERLYKELISRRKEARPDKQDSKNR